MRPHLEKLALLEEGSLGHQSGSQTKGEAHRETSGRGVVFVCGVFCTMFDRSSVLFRWFALFFVFLCFVWLCVFLGCSKGMHVKSFPGC